ncbi:unnamed protein product [Heterobilharzia americana]|nr:unnamed protein product [Heterobilharzia americana]
MELLPLSISSCIHHSQGVRIYRTAFPLAFRLADVYEQYRLETKKTLTVHLEVAIPSTNSILILIDKQLIIQTENFTSSSIVLSHSEPLKIVLQCSKSKYTLKFQSECPRFMYKVVGYTM